MIDWVSCILNVYGASPTMCGTIIVVAPDGSIEKETRRPLQVESSWSDKVSIKAMTWNQHFCEFHVSGNPSKWLQGHNVFGSDHPDLIRAFLLDVFSRFDGRPDLGSVRLTRIDTTRSFHLPSGFQVRQWLDAVAPYLRGRRQSSSQYEESGTLYVGQRSKRKTVKFYHKGPEFSKRLPKRFDKAFNTLLHSFADCLLRVEVCMRSEELKKLGCSSLLAWTPRTAGDLWRVGMSGVALPSQVEVRPAVLGELPKRLALVHNAWAAGVDLKATMSKSAWYRARAGLALHGIDIEKPPRPAASRVVPMLRPLEAVEAAPPEWLLPFIWKAA